jgi:transposase
MGKVGRPTKRTPEVEQAILNALQIGNTRTDAALGAGIDRGTLADWINNIPAFHHAVEKAEALARQRFVAQIAKAAAAGNWQAAAWNLERRDSENWGRRDRLDLTMDLRKASERLAAEAGLDPDTVFAEAEAILAGKR